nr:hypothetical protein KPHV_87050 [Kitasatospora purpeofusca]
MAALTLAALGWWGINAPYAAAGLIAVGTHWLFAWLAAAFLPLSGAVFACTLARIEAQHGRAGRAGVHTVLLLCALAYGYAAVSYPVGHPGHGPWYLAVYMGGLHVVFAYLVPRVIIAAATPRPAVDTAEQAG